MFYITSSEFTVVFGNPDPTQSISLTRHSVRSWAIFVTNQLIWTLLNLGANLKVWGYYCNQTSLSRTARHHQRSKKKNSKNISTNRPWNAIKTHAVVVYNTRALGEYSSTVFQPSSDLSTNKIDFVSSEVLSDIDSLVLSTAFFSRFAFASSKESCGSSLLKLLIFSQLFVRGYGIIGPVYHRPDRTIIYYMTERFKR